MIWTLNELDPTEFWTSQVRILFSEFKLERVFHEKRSGVWLLSASCRTLLNVQRMAICSSDGFARNRHRNQTSWSSRYKLSGRASLSTSMRLSGLNTSKLTIGLKATFNVTVSLIFCWPTVSSMSSASFCSWTSLQVKFLRWCSLFTLRIFSALSMLFVSLSTSLCVISASLLRL